MTGSEISSTNEVRPHHKRSFVTPSPPIFDVNSSLRIVNSATVLCARRRAKQTQEFRTGRTGGFSQRFKEKFGDLLHESLFLQSYLSEEHCPKDFEFLSGWEVLLGQNEVVNWVKSTSDNLAFMRYPGEFKLAGGNVDPGETLEEAAKREMIEEFLQPADINVPESGITLRPFSVKQTRPVRMRSNIMFNFLALADTEENVWLQNIDVNAINEALRKKRESFFTELARMGNAYYNLSKDEKEKLSPEVVQLSWIPLEEAFDLCISSEIPGTFTNSWQEQQFKNFNISFRDPFFVTALTLLELEKFPETESLRQHCEGVDMDSLRQKEQYLFDGMSSEELEEAYFNHANGKGVGTSILSLRMVSEERRKRMRDGARL